MIVFDNTYITLHYHAEINALEYEWKGFVPADQFRECMEKALVHFKERKATQMIPNLVKIRVVGPAEQAWFDEDLMPRFVSAGLKRAAIVQSETAFGAAVNKIIMQRLEAKNDGVERKVFGNYAEALEWLKKT